MIHESGTQYVLEIVDFFYDVGDVILALRLQYHHKFTAIGLTLYFGTGELLYLAFYALQVIGSGMYNHTRYVNFPLIHGFTLLVELSGRYKIIPDSLTRITMRNNI